VTLKPYACLSGSRRRAGTCSRTITYSKVLCWASSLLHPTLNGRTVIAKSHHSVEAGGGWRGRGGAAPGAGDTDAASARVAGAGGRSWCSVLRAGLVHRGRPAWAGRSGWCSARACIAGWCSEANGTRVVLTFCINSTRAVGEKKLQGKKTARGQSRQIAHSRTGDP